MRIAWLTPFSERSSTGRFSESVIAELVRYADLDLWLARADQPRATPLNVVHFSQIGSTELSALSGYDLTVYNIGNHLPFHRDSVQMAAKVPGICILHDIVMHHYFAAYYLEELEDREGYLRLMHRVYGDEGRREAAAAFVGKRKPVWDSEDVLRYPLFEEAIRGSLGVVTHTAYQRLVVEKRFAGPTCDIPIAYQRPAREGQFSRSDLGVPADHILMLTIGYVNPNKRIHAVIEALAQTPEVASRATYVVLGPHPPPEYAHLQQLVRRHGLKNTVRFTDYAPEEMLHSYLHHADICLNLRYPATEGASGTLVEHMLGGKALIVTDTAAYSDLPDDCVLKVPHDREKEELPAALRKLASDVEFRASLGRKGAGIFGAVPPCPLRGEVPAIRLRSASRQAIAAPG